MYFIIALDYSAVLYFTLLQCFQYPVYICICHCQDGSLSRTVCIFSLSSDVRDALAKALYGRLFSWIVNKVNQLLAPEEDLSSSSITEIGEFS